MQLQQGMFVDAHCHVSYKDKKNTTRLGDNVISKATILEQLDVVKTENADVCQLWMGTCLEDSQFGSVGVHPWYSYMYYIDDYDNDDNDDDGSVEDECEINEVQFDAQGHYRSVLSKWDDSWIELLPKPIKLNTFNRIDWSQVQCCGEIGLDKKFAIPQLPRRVTVTFEHQLKIFKWFLYKSIQFNLPVSIHCVGYAQSCYDTCSKIIKKHGNKIMLHSYSGSGEQLLQQWIPNFQDKLFITVSTLTCKKFPQLAAKLPISHLLTETDLPWNDLPPGLNIKSILEDLYQLIASLYELSLSEVEKIILSNFNKYLER